MHEKMPKEWTVFFKNIVRETKRREKRVRRLNKPIYGIKPEDWAPTVTAEIFNGRINGSGYNLMEITALALMRAFELGREAEAEASRYDN